MITSRSVKSARLHVHDQPRIREIGACAALADYKDLESIDARAARILDTTTVSYPICSTPSRYRPPGWAGGHYSTRSWTCGGRYAVDAAFVAHHNSKIAR